jgi:hypothetical protein
MKKKIRRINLKQQIEKLIISIKILLIFVIKRKEMKRKY